MTNHHKPTPGPAEVEMDTIAEYQRVLRVYTPPLNDLVEAYTICELPDDGDESKANAALICEAGTVYGECGLSPRQLLAERSENMAKLAEAIKQRDIVMTALVHIRDNSVIANDIVESECHCGLYDTDLTLEEFCAKAIAAAKTSKDGV